MTVPYFKQATEKTDSTNDKNCWYLSSEIMYWEYGYSKLLRPSVAGMLLLQNLKTSNMAYKITYWKHVQDGASRGGQKLNKLKSLVFNLYFMLYI